MLTRAAKPLDTGQEILTYPILNFLTIFIFILLHLAYPTKPLALVTAITKLAPWRLGGKPCTIHRTIKPKKTQVEQP
jgi:hypothetical protein